MLLFLNPTIKTQWKVWLFVQTFHCVFQHIHRRSSSCSALWIYTILKLFCSRDQCGLVSLPYGFTLFSNGDDYYIALDEFYYLMDLHYSQTAKQRNWLCYRFTTLWIYTILKQQGVHKKNFRCFTTLWIYTILKPCRPRWSAGNSFTTLWIYTILKPTSDIFVPVWSFTTLWIYTILKPTRTAHWSDCSFTTLWIYTILKH